MGANQFKPPYRDGILFPNLPDKQSQLLVKLQHTYGYKAGVRQPGVTLTLGIDPKKIDRLELIDEKLAQSFDVTLEPSRGIDPETLDAAAKASVELAWRVLLLANSILQAIQVPVFDPGRIVAAGPAEEWEGFFSVQVIVPRSDNVDSTPFDHAYQTASNLVMALAEQGGDDHKVAELQRSLHERFIKPLNKLMPGWESTVPTLANAYHQDIPFRHLSGGVYMLGWGYKAKLLNSSIVETDSAIGAKLSAQKFYTANILRGAGLPVPRHVPVSNEQGAIDAAEKIGWPVVIKPADGERGEGVTVNIRDNKSLLAAYRNTAGKDGVRLVEQQVTGVCHRIYVSYGKVLYASKRLPKLVTGDGVHTVAELIDEANNAELVKVPWRRLKPFPKDDEALRSLAEAGLKMDSVPAEGEQAPLRPTESTLWGGVVEDLTESIHPHNRDIAIQAARLFKLDSAGVDIISPDISIPWYENGAVINEVNFAPLIGSHRLGYKLDGSLAKIIANLMDGDGRIPIEVIVGKGSLDSAIERQRVFLDQDVKCFVTSESRTLSPDGEETPLASIGLFARCRALLMNPAAEALVIAVQNDEFVTTGLPVDRIDRLEVSDTDLRDWHNSEKEAGDDSVQDLLELLRSYTVGDDQGEG